MWYQALAEAGEGISTTAAGDPYQVDSKRLPPANAIMMLAAHVSRHRIFTEWIDPSILDESKPESRDPNLNLYDHANLNQPPYSADFLTTFADAIGHDNKQIHMVKGATHYYTGPNGRAHLKEASGVIGEFLNKL